MKQNGQWLSHVRTRSNTGPVSAAPRGSPARFSITHLPLEPAASQLQLDDGLVDLELITDDVAHGLTVDGTELVAGAESGEIRRGTGRNRLDTGSRHRKSLRARSEMRFAGSHAPLRDAPRAR